MDKILNPLTGRMVLRNGRIGKHLTQAGGKPDRPKKPKRVKKPKPPTCGAMLANYKEICDKLQWDHNDCNHTQAQDKLLDIAKGYHDCSTRRLAYNVRCGDGCPTHKFAQQKMAKYARACRRKTKELHPKPKPARVHKPKVKQVPKPRTKPKPKPLSKSSQFEQEDDWVEEEAAISDWEN